MSRHQGAAAQPDNPSHDRVVVGWSAGWPVGQAVGGATYGAEAEGVDLDTKGGHVLLLELASQVALDESGLDPTNVLLAPLADQKFGAHFATPQSIEGGCRSLRRAPAGEEG